MGIVGKGLSAGAKFIYRSVVPLSTRLAFRDWREERQAMKAAAAAARSESEPELPQPDLGAEVAALVKPLIESGEYRNYLDFWQEQGFHIAPDYYQIKRQGFAAEGDSDLPSLEFCPNLFILGAAKAGTSTLHAYLDKMPSVCMSEPKEPYFFECEYGLGLKHYQEKYFPHWNGERFAGESRHRNLYLPWVPDRIHQTSPDAKLIILLRNPIDRAYSHWWYWYSRHIEPLEFADAIQKDMERVWKGQILETPEEQEAYCARLDSSGKGLYRTYLDTGYYHVQVYRYMQLFPHEQIKIMWFSDLVEKPFECIMEVQEFLGLDYYNEENFEKIHANAALEDESIKRPPMEEETREWLADHYAEHNRLLTKLTERDLSHWK